MQPVILGLLASFVGFSSSFAVVLQGYLAMGATPAQAASGLTIITFSMGALGAWFSFRTRMPVAIAWSTPGAALLVASLAPNGGFAAAVATAWMATDRFAGTLLGIAAFVAIGVGAGAAGTSLLVLMAKRVDPVKRAAAATIAWTRTSPSKYGVKARTPLS